MRRHALELESFEAVVPGGVRRVTWLVESEREWRLASELPGASVEMCDVGPGMVWLRRVTLELPPGARLLRVETAPKRAVSQDPLAYLFDATRARARETRRTPFVVGAAGKLERVTRRPRA